MKGGNDEAQHAEGFYADQNITQTGTEGTHYKISVDQVNYDDCQASSGIRSSSKKSPNQAKLQTSTNKMDDVVGFRSLPDFYNGKAKVRPRLLAPIPDTTISYTDFIDLGCFVSISVNDCGVETIKVKTASELRAEAQHKESLMKRQRVLSKRDIKFIQSLAIALASKYTGETIQGYAKFVTNAYKQQRKLLISHSTVRSIMYRLAAEGTKLTPKFFQLWHQYGIKQDDFHSFHRVMRKR